jgi:hypothetical protein
MPVADAEVRYETRTVRTVRGMKARTQEKWQKLGWEIVSESQLSMFRADIVLRRVKKKLPKYVLPLAIDVPVAAFAGLIVLGVATVWQKDSAPETRATTQNSEVASSPSDVPATSSPSSPAQVSTNQTASGLQWTWAWATCEAHGKQQFSYGYHDSLAGMYAKAIHGDTWWLKYQATITNAYGADQVVDVECTVGGSNDNPVVQRFIDY